MGCLCFKAVALAAALLCIADGQYQSQSGGQLDTFGRDRPGQPTVDITHYKDVYVRCDTPSTQTSPTSPIFDSYLADLGATFPAASNPLPLVAKCKRDHMNGNVAACGFFFDPSDYYRQAITNMDGRPRLSFSSCNVQLDGGNVASSNTCWTDADSTAQPAVVRSAQSESDLGPTAFSVTLNDRNPAVGGTYVGSITVNFKCKYYLPPGTRGTRQLLHAAA